MVVNGNVAIGQGVGTMNGEAGYSFVFSVVDGAYRGGHRDEGKEDHRSDKFRIRISKQDHVIYDNEKDSPVYAEATHIISSGYIVLRDCREDDDERENSVSGSSINPTPGVEFFPNPIKSRMTVRVPDANAETSFYMMDFSGRQYTLNHLPSSSGETHAFDVEDLPPGLYMLRVQNGANSSSVKIVKN